MRVFIGIGFDESVKKYLLETQEYLKTTFYQAKFTHYDNFHITLKYIGLITHHELDSLYQIVNSISKTYKAFNIKIGDLGSYNIRGKQLFWIDVTEGKKALQKLYNKVEQALVFEEFKADQRKYNPHVTIAREVVLNNHLNTSKRLPVYKEPINVNKITIFESHRVNGLLTYTPLYECELVNGDEL
ncbi:RNA 2',3'-cyclic phosphodiesterase [Liberiplasma polymorphum]|uniref:RNA 2',3'-cyclic phosphodiesterase n=1 Tax=Liberiplasma polymorphum TaxID=3374570 RepID=UPI0037743853